MPLSSIRFEFHRLEGLPRLAWCARVRVHDPVVQVFHGPWVETWVDGFFEGAWNGDFDEHTFDQATVCTGTGARMTDAGLVFVTASDRLNCIYSKCSAGSLWISNSRIFLLVMTGDEYDFRQAFYYTIIHSHYSSPYWAPDKFIPTRDGRIEILDYGNFLLGPGLKLVRSEKPDPGPPRSFDHYRDLLVSCTRELFINAASDKRCVTYQPLSMLSRGYDSTAVTAIARAAGCREAMTFATINGEANPDSGTAIGRSLDLECHEIEQYAYQAREDVVEAEFCADGYTGFHVVYASMEELLGKRVLCSGFYGGLWNYEYPVIGPGLVPLNEKFLAGASLGEFRLRAGFQQFPVPYIGARNCQEIFELTHSREMAPWRLDISYNKPIARRIAEEAGIPRKVISPDKLASGFIWLNYPEKFSPPAWKDFMHYYTELSDQVPAGAWVWPRLAHRSVGYYEAGLNRLKRWYPDAKRFSYVARISTAAEYMWPWEIRFTMHWGSARIRDRYRPALAATSEDSIGKSTA